jgi:DNA-binding beta-propeller fold protein YncE
MACVVTSNGMVTPIDVATDVAETPFSITPTNGDPFCVAITPNGQTAYITNNRTSQVTPVNWTPECQWHPLGVGSAPQGIAITPDGQFAYTSNDGNASVSAIDLATRIVVGTITPPGINHPGAIVAVTPDQAPTAAFTDTPGAVGSATTFDASTVSEEVVVAEVPSPKLQE